MQINENILQRVITNLGLIRNVEKLYHHRGRVYLDKELKMCFVDLKKRKISLEEFQKRIPKRFQLLNLKLTKEE